MPKLLAHEIFAEDVRRRMPAQWKLRRLVERYPNLYRFGAMLPDVPFFLLWGPGSGAFHRQAERFHENGAEIERFLASALAGTEEAEKRLAVAAGIFCHAAADAVFHPMVYYYSGAGTDGARWRHHRLEGFIDIHFSRNFTRCPPFYLEPLVQGLEAEIDTLIGWMARIFALERHRRRFYPALRRNALFFRLFSSPAARRIAGWAAPAAPVWLKAYLAHFYPYRLPSGRLFADPIAYRNPASGSLRQWRIEEMAREVSDAALAVLARIETGEYRIRSLLPDGWNLHTGIGALPKSAMVFFDTARPLRDIVGF